MTPSDLDQALNALRDKIAGGPSVVPGLNRRLADIASSARSTKLPALTLPQTANDRHQQRRLFMRITMTSGIAACLLAAAGLLWLTRSDRTASAAEELQQAVQTTTAYKGWIHQTASSAGLTPPPGTLALPKRVTYHTNTADGTVAEVREYAARLDVTMYFPQKREMATYSGQSNEIRLGSLSDERAKAVPNIALPATVGEMLTMIKTQMVHEPASVKETPEGDLKRYDIVFFASDAEARKFREERNGDPLLRGMTVWVNRDKLMTRVKFDDPSVPVTLDATYGPPEIHDIYDLGVPHSAKIIDERVKDDLKSLMARLDQRPLKGFGDYVALLCSYNQDAAGKVSPDYGYVTLYAAKGDKWLANEYRLVSTNRPGPEVVLKELPPKWTAPDIAQLLPALLATKPTQYFIMDGDHGWSGWYDYQSMSYPNARSITPPERNARLGDQALAGNFGPTSDKTGIGSPGTTAEVLQDKAHPGPVGLHYKRVPTPQNGTSDTSEDTWWFDPARNDVPVEETWTSTDLGQTKPRVTMHTLYTKYAQLPTGQWYPTDWHEDRTDRNARSGQESASTSYYRLQILPDLKLDDNWFTDPRPRVTTAPATK